MNGKLLALGDEAGHLLATGRGREDILSFLRRSGCSKIDCIKVLMRVESLTLQNAKAAVHLSEAWADRRAADDGFHGALIRALQEPDLTDPSEERVRIHRDTCGTGTGA